MSVIDTKQDRLLHDCERLAANDWFPYLPEWIKERIGRALFHSLPDSPPLPPFAYPAIEQALRSGVGATKKFDRDVAAGERAQSAGRPHR